MTVDHLQFRLSEMNVPDGEIELADLVAIGAKLQELSTRVGRWVVDVAGPGRSPGVLEDLTTLRLAGISRGSTVLEISRGSPETLDVADPVEEQIEARFWQVLAGIAEDSPPPDAPDGVRESALGVLDALGHGAGRVEVVWPVQGSRLAFRPSQRRREVWMPIPREETPRSISVTGRLEMVDLGRGRFRIRDDAGNAIPLEHVTNPHGAAHLIGQITTATGSPSRPRRGLLAVVDAVVVAAAPLPDAWTPGREPDSWLSELAKRGPDPAGAAAMSDDEFASFLAAARGE